MCVYGHYLGLKSTGSKVLTGLSLQVVLVVLASSVPGQAFEVDGFRSGMSVNEALLEGRKYDANIKPYQPIPGTAWLVVRETKDGNNLKNWQMTFCNGQLVELARSYPFSWLAAAEIVSQLNSQYGKGSVGSEESDLHIGAGNTKPFNVSPGGVSNVGIELSWDNDVEWVSVSIKLVKTNETVISTQGRSEETIDEMYALRDSGCFEDDERLR